MPDNPNATIALELGRLSQFAADLDQIRRDVRTVWHGAAATVDGFSRQRVRDLVVNTPAGPTFKDILRAAYAGLPNSGPFDENVFLDINRTFLSFLDYLQQVDVRQRVVNLCAATAQLQRPHEQGLIDAFANSWNTSFAWATVDALLAGGALPAVLASLATVTPVPMPWAPAAFSDGSRKVVDSVDLVLGKDIS